jgi:ribosomal protein S18 acetylase RimI-like enzyme
MEVRWATDNNSVVEFIRNGVRSTIETEGTSSISTCETENHIKQVVQVHTDDNNVFQSLRQIRVAFNEAGKPIGFIWFVVSNMCPFGSGSYLEWMPDKVVANLVWIKYIFVTESHRNKGVADELVRDLFDYVIPSEEFKTKSAPIHSVQTSVSVTNEIARGLFKKFEFKPYVELYSAPVEKIRRQATGKKMEEFTCRWATNSQEDIEFVVYGQIDIYEEENEAYVLENELKTMEEVMTNAVRSGKNEIAIIERTDTKERCGFIRFETIRVCPFGIGYLPRPKEFVWITNVYVQKSLRGLGLGKRLYGFVAECAEKESIEEIVLDVYVVNVKSQGFHEKLGFVKFLSIFESRYRLV